MAVRKKATVRAQRISSATNAAPSTKSTSSTALQSRKEYGLLGRRKAADELRTALAPAHRSGEAGSSQFVESTFRVRQGRGVVGIKFMAGVAGRVHHNLPGHGRPSL